MIEYLTVLFILYFFYTRIFKVSNSHYVLTERKWLVILNKWGSLRLLSAGTHFFIPFVDGIKYDKGGKPIQFSSNETEILLNFKIVFNNSMQILFNIKCLY